MCFSDSALTTRRPVVIYSLKSQIGDSEGLGGKLDKADKLTLNDEIKKSQDWLEEFGSSASAEDYDEQREALQAVVSPITSKLVSFDVRPFVGAVC